MSRQLPDGSHASDKKHAASPYLQLLTGSGQRGGFAWGAVNPDLIADAIDAVTARGDAISFAVNRNGTAGSITILSGADRPRFFAADVAEAEALLVSIKQAS